MPAAPRSSSSPGAERLRKVASAAIGWGLTLSLGCGIPDAEGRPYFDACAAASARPALSAQLLFGVRRRDGSLVSTAAWQRFLAERITPRFPDGLTVLSGRGQWRDPNGRMLKEPSRVVLIVTRSGAKSVAALQAIRAEYKAAFGQDSVGLVLSRSCAAF